MSSCSPTPPSRAPATPGARRRSPPAADIDFVAPAHEGDALLATAQERARYGRSGIYDVRVTRGDELVAEFRGRSRALRGADSETGGGAGAEARS